MHKGFLDLNNHSLYSVQLFVILIFYTLK